MPLDDKTFRKLLSKDLMDLIIRVGLIAFVVVMSVRIFAPFAALMLWALILAVALYPLHRGLVARIGGRQGTSATLLVVAGLLLIGIPTVMLGSSFADRVQEVYLGLENQTLTIPQPKPAVAEWPLIGERVFDAWSGAARDLPEFLEEHEPQIKNLSGKLLSAAASTAAGVLQFLGALIIAGIMMAYGEGGSRAMQRIANRLAGPSEGPRVYGLSTATIRSVATGVIGVAFIQALLLGIGFIMAGVPGAGVLAVVVLLIGIMQLPALIISLPVIAYLWMAGDASTTINIIFTVYLLLAGSVDNVLKPLLLGRGVDVPMPIVLIGALGGMVSAGIIGLFVGAVLLGVGYQLFMGWVDNPDDTTAAPDDPAAEAPPTV